MFVVNWQERSVCRGYSWICPATPAKGSPRISLLDLGERRLVEKKTSGWPVVSGQTLGLSGLLGQFEVVESAGFRGSKYRPGKLHQVVRECGKADGREKEGGKVRKDKIDAVREGTLGDCQLVVRAFATMRLKTVANIFFFVPLSSRSFSLGIILLIFFLMPLLPALPTVPLGPYCRCRQSKYS